MYFEIEDYKPDITPVGSVISWREGVLISIIVHLAAVIFVLVAPRWLPSSEARPRQMAALPPPEEKTQFVFVQPRVDMKALKPPVKGPSSDQDREAATLERPQQQKNPMPFSRGNTPERVEQSQPDVARGQGPTPEPSEAQTPQTDQAAPEELPRIPEASSSLELPNTRTPLPNPAPRRMAGGSLGDALRNLQRYVQKDQFENSGGGGAFGPAIQFDTKGVEFGPWIRRFIAQVKRNWEPLIPLSAMTSKGHVVVTFNVHKDGSLTDLNVAGPSQVSAFNTAAYGALSSSNPTAALPPEYPADKAFFTVTFFYNEDPQ